jgi:exodeoxyribonuclease-5
VAQVLRQHRRRVVLLAPTGRAAKVAAQRTGLQASTLHHEIYLLDDEAGAKARLRPSRHPKGSVYIIDEASMLDDTPTPDAFGRAEGLLRDVLRYAWKTDPEARLLLVGDPAQLPPVGRTRSPALAEKYLRETLNLTVTSINLTEVRRQALESGILLNATRIRQAMASGQWDALPTLQLGPDVRLLETGQEALDTFLHLFDPEDPEAVAVLTYGNPAAADFNLAIRNTLFHEPDVITEHDRVMAVRNYYYTHNQKLQFVANGEAGVVRRVNRASRHLWADQEWAEVEVEFPPTQGTEPAVLEALVPLGLLYARQPSFSQTELRQLAERRTAELAALGLPHTPEHLRADPYLNALQLKMAYALTGHKAQGGQWRDVIVLFEPWLFRTVDDEGKPRNLLEALRWSYTALSRASQRLWLLAPPFPTEPGPEPNP